MDTLTDGDPALRRQLLLQGSWMSMAAGAAWGVIYGLAGEPVAAVIPLLYVTVSGVSVCYYVATHRFGWFRFSQLSLILILPFALQLTLGGFVGSSAVILWSLLAPFGALVFDD